MSAARKSVKGGKGSTSTKRAASKDSVPFWKRDLSSLRQPKAPSADDGLDRGEFAPHLPLVDLLPDRIRVLMRAGHVRRRIIGAGILIVLIGAVVWFLQNGQISNAETGLDAEKARSIDLTSQAKALSPVQALDAEITSQREFVQQTLASQPLAKDVTAAILDHAQQAGVDTVASIVVDYHGIPEPGGDLNPCPNPDPFHEEITVGCVTFSATAKSRQEVAALLTELDGDPLFVGPYVTDTQVSDQDTGTVVTFSGTVGVSPEALVVALTQEELDLIANPPAPSPTASAQGQP